MGYVGTFYLVFRVIVPLTSGREKKGLWSNPNKALFDWLLKHGFISSHFQILNSKFLFLLYFYLHEFEDDPEINLITTYPFLNVLVFENRDPITDGLL